MEIVIEELSRSGKVKTLHKLQGSKIRIGRGYDCQLTIQDQHVDAAHAELQCIDGQWYLRDLHSTNGTFYSNGQALESMHLVRSGEVFTIGKSIIRIVEPNHPVAATEALSEHEGWINMISNPFISLGILLASLIILVMMRWIQTPKELEAAEVVSYVLSLTVACLIWSVFMAVLSKINKHEARFFSQLGLASIFMTSYILWEFADKVITFNITQQWLHAAQAYFVDFWFIAGLVWLSLTIGFNHTKSKRWIISLSIGSAMTGYALLQNSTDKFDYLSQLEYNAKLMSPQFQWRQEANLEEYLDQADALFDKVATEAAKAKKAPQSSQPVRQKM